MKNLRNRDGFTLMELLVTIVAGSLVTLAATTVLLLGLRMNRHSMDTVKQQNTTRIVLSVLEDMASESSIKKVITTPDAWYICSTENDAPEETEQEVVDTVLLAFISEDKKIYTGGTVTTELKNETNGSGLEAYSKYYTYTKNNETAILDGVSASSAVLDDNQLLTFSIETEEGSYSSSTYCRMAPKRDSDDAVIDKWEENPDSIVEGEVSKGEGVSGNESTAKARAEFLKVAASQRGSPGLILEKIPVNDERKYIYMSVGEHYSHWYNPNWEPETPWCAIFVTWCLSNHPEGRDRWIKDQYAEPSDKEPQLLNMPLNTDVAVVHVDTLIKYLDTGVYVENKTTGETELIRYGDADETYWYPSKIEFNSKSGKFESTNDAYENPLPGDLIFFDWVADGVQDCDHVGIVLTVTNEYVYTIEGNTADTVAVRRYGIHDPRIMGYGVLDWKTDIEFDPAETE